MDKTKMKNDNGREPARAFNLLLDRLKVDKNYIVNRSETFIRLREKKYTHVLLYTGAFSPMTIAHCLSIVSAVNHLVSQGVSVDNILVILSPVGQAYGKTAVNKDNTMEDQIV